jgi:hypothetical protein
VTLVAAWSAAEGETSAMGGGAPDPEGKASAKRKRIDALDRRLAGGRGASSSAARASVSRPGDLSRGRDGDRPSPARRDARGPRAGGRGARDGTPASSRPPSRPPFDAGRDKKREPTEFLSSSGDRRGPTDLSDAAWYADLSKQTRVGVFASAHFGSIPRSLLLDTTPDGSGVVAARLARYAYVERTLVELAETSCKTGADVDAVVRGKTRDKVFLLDAANGNLTSSREDAKKATRNKSSEKAPSRLAQHASNARLRVLGVRGALPETPFADGLADALGTLKPLTETHFAFLSSLLDSVSSAESVTDTKRLERFKRLVLELGEIRGGTVSVTSCRDGKLVGRRGVVARVTKRAAHVVAVSSTSGDRVEDEEKKKKRVGVFVAPRRGTTFRLELPSVPGIQHGEEDASLLYVDIRGENLAGG